MISGESHFEWRNNGDAENVEITDPLTIFAMDLNDAITDDTLRPETLLPFVVRREGSVDTPEVEEAGLLADPHHLRCPFRPRSPNSASTRPRCSLGSRSTT